MNKDELSNNTAGSSGTPPSANKQHLSSSSAGGGSTGGSGGVTGSGGRLLTSCTQRNSQDDLEQKDLVCRHECLKLVRELNREVTAYRSLLLGLGSVGDCEQLREDLKKTRRKAQMLIKDLKTKLVPWVTSNYEVGQSPEWERVWTIFVCCVDVLQQEMAKTLSLQQTFCLYSDSCSLINAGWGNGEPCVRVTADNLSLDVFLEKMYTEREETMQLERELTNLQQVVTELRCCVKIKISLSESIDSISIPGNNNRFPSNTEAGFHQSEQSSLMDQVRTRQKNCICWAIIAMISTFVLAAIVGACFNFLS